MEVFYVGTEKFYNYFVWREIQETIGQTNRLTFLESNRFKSDFKAIVEKILFSFNRTTACIVMDTENENAFDFVIQVNDLHFPYL